MPAVLTPYVWVDEEEETFIWFMMLMGLIIVIDLYVYGFLPPWMSPRPVHANIQIKSSAEVRHTLHSDDNLTSTTTDLDTSKIATKDDISRLETLIQEQQETFASKMKVQQETSTIALADIKTSIDYILKNQKSTQTYNKPSSNHNKTVRELELQEQLGEKCDTIYDMGRKLHKAQREISDMKHEMEQLRRAKTRAENLQIRFERNASQPRYEEVRKMMVVPITEQTPIRPQHTRSNTSAKIASVPPPSTTEKSLDSVPTSTVNDVSEKPLEIVPPPSLESVPAQYVDNESLRTVDNEPAQSINDVPEKTLESTPAPALEVVQAQPVNNIPVQTTVDNEPAQPVNHEPKEALKNVSIRPLDNGPAQPAVEKSAQPSRDLLEQLFVPVSSLSAPFRRIARVRGSTNKATNKVTKKVRFAPQTTSMGGSRGKAISELLTGEIPSEENNDSSGSGQPAAVVENAEEMEAVPTPTAEPPPASASIPEVTPSLQCDDQPAPAPQAEDAAMGEAATTSSPSPEASDMPVVAKNIDVGKVEIRDSPIYPPAPALSAPVRRRPTAIEMTEMAENGSPLYLPSRVRESTPAPSSAPVAPAAGPAVRPQFSVTDPRYTAPAPAFSPAATWNRPAYSPYSPAPGSWVPPAPAGATLTPVEERMRRGRRGRL